MVTQIADPQPRPKTNSKSPNSELILGSSTTEPGPSGMNNGQNQDDMSDDDSNDIRCICKQFSPPGNRVNYIRIGFKWIQCEVCEGFKCPHCNKKEEKVTFVKVLYQ